MGSLIVEAKDHSTWRNRLHAFARTDVCQMPEYHVAYSTRIANSRPMLWSYQEDQQQFCYPFLLTPVAIKGMDGQLESTPYFDVSSIYGHSGPLSTTQDRTFIDNAWKKFDDWCHEQKVIAEFTRFSEFAGNQPLAHAQMTLEKNRPIAVSDLIGTDESLLNSLGSKTRNMIRKAQKSGLIAKELQPKEWLTEFRRLYLATMERNQAPKFFFYNDQYYHFLMSLPQGEFRLFGVFFENQLVSSAIALVHNQGALYHLGASKTEFSNLGASNLCLYEMSRSLQKSGVQFLNLGGGRTTSQEDPLFRFKKSNGNRTSFFYIGKRVIDPTGYADVVKRWQLHYKTEIHSPHLIFYRD